MGSRQARGLANVRHRSELAKWTVVRNWVTSRRSQMEVWTAQRPLIPYEP